MVTKNGPEIAFKEIRLSDRVGEGNSSVVFDGIWNEHRVAVKQLKGPVVDDKLIAEVTRLQYAIYLLIYICQ